MDKKLPIGCKQISLQDKVNFLTIRINRELIVTNLLNK